MKVQMLNFIINVYNYITEHSQTQAAKMSNRSLLLVIKQKTNKTFMEHARARGHEYVTKAF